MLSIKRENEEINFKAEPIDNVCEVETQAVVKAEPIDDFPAEYTNGDLSPEYMPLYIKEEESLDNVNEKIDNETINGQTVNNNNVKKRQTSKRKIRENDLYSVYNEKMLHTEYTPACIKEEESLDIVDEQIDIWDDNEINDSRTDNNDSIKKIKILKRKTKENDRYKECNKKSPITEYVPTYIKEEESLDIVDDQIEIRDDNEIDRNRRKTVNDNSNKKRNKKRKILKRKIKEFDLYKICKETRPIMCADGGYLYPCNFCDKSYKNKVHATRHMRYQCKENRLMNKPVVKHFKCKLCSTEFTTKYTLQRHHLFKHDRSSRDTYSCDDCNKMFRDKYDLKRHLKLENCRSPYARKENASYSCKKCKMEFSNRSSLRQHRFNHCMERASLFKCAHCDFVTMHKGGLPRHLERKHSEPKFLTCPRCSKSFNGDFNLRQHLKRSCNTEKIFKCDHCSYKAKRNHCIAEHIRKKHTWVKA